MNNNYQPVPCTFMDIIEDFATRRVKGRIVYFSKGKKNEIFDSLKTWIVEDGQEFLTTEHSEKIRLDRIIELYGNLGPVHGGHSTSCV